MGGPGLPMVVERRYEIVMLRNPMMSELFLDLDILFGLAQSLRLSLSGIASYLINLPLLIFAYALSLFTGFLLISLP